MKLVTNLLGVLLLLSSFTSNIVWATGGNRYALVIGNEAYTKFRRLDNPVIDARGVKRALEDIGFQVFYHENLRTKQDMKRAVESFTQRLGNRTVGLFYYAGHGVQVNGKNYLIPTRANIRSQSEVARQALSASDDVLDLMENGRIGINVVVLDACRDNPFPKTRSGRTRSLGNKRGLAEMSTVEDSIIVYSTAANEEAQDGRKGEHSPFTKYFIRGLITPNISFMNMINVVGQYVRDEVYQRPYVYHPAGVDFCMDCSGTPQRTQPPERTQPSTSRSIRLPNVPMP